MTLRPPTVGFVAALEMEGRWLEGVVERRLVAVGGVGWRRAEVAARRLLDRGATALVSWGVAGGLDPGLQPGSVVLVDAVHSGEDAELGSDNGWLSALRSSLGDRVPVSVGALRHTDRVVRSVADKGTIRGERGASVVDMETLGVAGVAVEAAVPWIAVRAVADTAAMCLPPAITDITDETGRIRPVPVLRLVVRPWHWLDLVRLGRASAAAGRSMKAVVATAGAGLALPAGSG
jgi:adenosylhomocysteine nucleosidase